MEKLKGTNNILKRQIAPELKRALADFIDAYKINGMSPLTAKLYYSFIVASYMVSREKRYSIELLAEAFSLPAMKISLLLNIYVHSLYCLAYAQNKEIYEDFIV